MIKKVCSQITEEILVFPFRIYELIAFSYTS